MKAFTLLTAALGCAVLLTVSVRAFSGERSPVSTEDPAENTAVDLAGGVRAIVYARPFGLIEGYDHQWRSDPFHVTEGWLLVLQVASELAVASNEHEPILYAGDQTMERINSGLGSARIVCVLPGAVDLAATPMWYGAPGLPEEVTARTIARERVAAERAGVAPLSPVRLGDPVLLPSRAELHRLAATLVLEHAPQEQDLASGLLAPRVK